MATGADTKPLTTVRRQAAWTYDTATGGKEKLASATRFVGTDAHTETIGSHTAPGSGGK